MTYRIAFKHGSGALEMLQPAQYAFRDKELAQRTAAYLQDHKAENVAGRFVVVES